MRIYLLGFMGAGKSTRGPVVAERGGLGFLDLDEEIAGAAGRDIPQIFADEGEAGFRRRESEALRKAAARGDLVVATGGGIVEYEGNHDLLRQAHAVYLRWTWEQLWRRLANRRGDRPLLEEGEAAMRARWRRRERLYREFARQELDMREAGQGERRQLLLAGLADRILAAAAEP